MTARAAYQSSGPAAAARPRILYAEDQMSARTVTTALLERMGYDVIAVEDGELAVEEARAGAFDVILLDIEMPVMDGVTAARSIRAELAHCKDTPILALSAFLADSTEQSPWRDAFDSALPKPANSNQLQAAMQKAMSRRQAVQEAIIVSDGGVTWADFGPRLPSGTAAMVARVAHEEVEHVILTWAACLEAGDHANADSCKAKLAAMARCFSIRLITDALDALVDPVTRQDLHRLLVLAAQWRALEVAQGRRK